jgi:hypothetical protein
MITDDNAQDWADRVGRRVSAIFIALLIALFAYGYIGQFIFG